MFDLCSPGSPTSDHAASSAPQVQAHSTPTPHERIFHRFREIRQPRRLFFSANVRSSSRRRPPIHAFRRYVPGPRPSKCHWLSWLPMLPTS